MTAEEMKALISAKCDSVEQFFTMLNKLVAGGGSSRTYGVLGNELGGVRRLDNNATSVVRDMLGLEAQACDTAPAYMEASEGDYTIYMGLVYGASNRDEALKETWWWHREQLRVKYTYPPRTEVLQRAVTSFNLQAFCVHPSTDPDAPYAISYTPDPTFGKADRQLKVATLGKFLRKMCPVLSDTHIAKLEAMHRAAMDPHFYVATTEAEIIEVYRNMEGDGGCMRYDGTHWGLPDDMHPSMVYAAPGISVAYTKNSNGKISSRALIFERADGQKCYLRIYGDSVLKTKLVRAGYIMGPLSGMKIRAIKHPNPKYKGVTNAYLAPYIDGQGGQQSDENGVYGYIDSSDPGFIRLVSTDQRSMITRMFPNHGNLFGYFKHHQTVVVTIDPISVEPWVCVLSGERHDPLVDGPGLYVWVDGKVGLAAKAAVIDRGWTTDIWAIGPNRNLCAMWRDPDVDVPWFEHPTSMRRIADTDEFRLASGFLKLHPDYYPNETDWVQPGDGIQQIENPDGTLAAIRRDDAGYRIAANGRLQLTYLPAELAKAEVSTGKWVQTLVYNSHRCIASTENEMVVQIRSGRRAVKGVHDLVQCYDGSWTTPRMANKQVVMSVPFYVPVDMSSAAACPSREIVTKVFLKDRPTLQSFVSWIINNYVGVDFDIQETIRRTKKQVLSRAVSMFNHGRDYDFPDVTSGADGDVLVMSSAGVDTWDTMQSRVAKFQPCIDAGRVENQRAVGVAQLAILIVDIVQKDILPHLGVIVPTALRDDFEIISEDEFDNWMAENEPETVPDTAPVEATVV